MKDGGQNIPVKDLMTETDIPYEIHALKSNYMPQEYFLLASLF